MPRAATEGRKWSISAPACLVLEVAGPETAKELDRLAKGLPRGIALIGGGRAAATMPCNYGVLAPKSFGVPASGVNRSRGGARCGGRA